MLDVVHAGLISDYSTGCGVVRFSLQVAWVDSYGHLRHT